jgi:DNA-binding transcriptional ArsR family regulator
MDNKDTQKTIQKTSTGVAQEERHMAPSAQEKNTKMIVFGNDSSLMFLYTKTERLISALYMVTDLLKDVEPLKWKVRESALNLMSHTMAYNSGDLLSRTQWHTRSCALIGELISFLEVSFRSGTLSEMNFEVIKNEMESLLTLLSEESFLHTLKGGGVHVEKSFFVDDYHEALAHTSEVAGGREKSVIGTARRAIPTPTQKDTHSVLNNRQQTSAQRHAPRSAEHRSTQADVHPAPGTTSNSTHVGREHSSERRSAILALLAHTPEISIKDVSRAVTGYSEKTLQRELLAMVAEGLLYKQGERRWSRYSLR